jgi:3-deoxy-D-glycero-D-galacto-nononate 9-phosphate synthase
MNSTYIIGEIGQNHNGSVDIAKLIIDMVSVPVNESLFDIELKGIDAVKLTKRDLNEELSDSQMKRPYTGLNSFGPTYGEHREFLELSFEQHKECFNYAKSKGLEFVETLCSISCIDILNYFTPDYLKVASRDLTNLPLLDALAQTKLPMIVSSGMAGKAELDNAIDVITKHHSNLGILHCVSEYPTRPENVNLKTINYLQKHYGEFKIGYSDHTIGISSPALAVALGAEIIEKHITIDRRMKGTDQKGSLGPDGVNRMIRDIRLTEMSLGKEEIHILDSVKPAQTKLERSIASKRELKAGEVLTEEDFHMLSPGDGYKWAEKDKLIGQTMTKDLSKNEIIYPEFIQ